MGLKGNDEFPLMGLKGNDEFPLKGFKGINPLIYILVMALREEIQKLYKEIRENPDDFGCLKTDELLSAYEKNGNKYLENKSNKDIENEKLESFNLDNCLTNLSKVERIVLMKKLIGYRYVDEIDSLHIGKYTRWIQKYPLTDDDKVFKYVLSPGAFLTVIDYMDSGIVLTLKTWNNKVFKITFDNCLIYQKLSSGEELILMTADYLQET